MKSIFDEVSIACSKLTTKRYSTSFSLGIWFLESRFRNPIYSIYGFVRFADEIVDSFHDFDKAELLARFKKDTHSAIAEKISLNPILNSFQEVVNQYNIDLDLVEKFLNSMEMDLDKTNYTREKYDDYIVGSAEVVGLMCLHVFVENDDKLYAELKPYAMKLGAAFQKVNFLRDLKNDVETLGRMYFPGLTEDGFNEETKRLIELEIAADFEQAMIGIRKLPKGSRMGVYLAYVYYTRLFSKIQQKAAETILMTRIRVSNPRKMSLMFGSFVRHKLNWL